MTTESESSRTLVTHPHLDLDAIASLVFADPEGRRPIEFVPANAAVRPPHLLKAQWIDHPLGTKAAVDRAGRSAAAALAVAPPHVPAELLAEINEADVTGGVRRPGFSLPKLVGAARLALLENHISGDSLDRRLLEIFRPILRGLCLQARKEPTFGCRVGPMVWAVPKEGCEALGAEPIDDEGWSCRVYDEDNHLGIVRRVGRERPDLSAMSHVLPHGWFVHDAGYLCAWGTRKGPVSEPPPEGGPQNAQALVRLARRVFA